MLLICAAAHLPLGEGKARSPPLRHFVPTWLPPVGEAVERSETDEGPAVNYRYKHSSSPPRHFVPTWLPPVGEAVERSETDEGPADNHRYKRSSSATAVALLPQRGRQEAVSPTIPLKVTLLLTNHPKSFILTTLFALRRNKQYKLIRRSMARGRVTW